MEEYLQVINRPKFALSNDIIQKWKELIYKSTTIENPISKIVFLPDKFDSKFIDLAVDCEADFIITGDSHFENVEKDYNVKIISVLNFYNTFVNI